MNSSNPVDIQSTDDRNSSIRKIYAYLINEHRNDEQPHDACLLNDIEDFVVEIAKSNDLAFEKVIHKGWINDRITYKAINKLAYFKKVTQYPILRPSTYSISIYCNIFYSAVDEMAKQGFFFLTTVCQKENKLMSFHEQFNLLIILIREQLRTKEIKQQLALDRHNEIRTYKVINKFIDSLFKLNHVYTVIRMDLAYLRSYFEEISPRRMFVDLGTFLNNTRHYSSFNQLRGYIWKSSYSEVMGFNTHIILFFELTDHFHVGHIEIVLNEYWCNAITHGKGCTYPCNSSDKHIRHKVGGKIISLQDQTLINALQSSIFQLVRADQFMRHESMEGHRTYSKGLRSRTKAQH